ncbi:MAG: HEAT repeat domain-containing protein, partial [Pirellulales bacterium]
MRRRAIEGLVALADKAVPVLNAIVLAGNLEISPERTRQAVNAVWALERIGTERARISLRTALGNRNDLVRQAAIHSVSLLRDRRALPKLTELLDGGSPQNRRAAAEAIGRIGRPESVSDLFRAIDQLPSSPESSGDRVLEHSLLYALIEIGDAKTTVAGLESKNPVVQRAALIALDQMPDGALTAQAVTPFLSAGDAELRRTAGWIVGRHPEWADALADYLRVRMADESLSADDRAELANQLGSFAQSIKIQELLAARLADKDASDVERRTALAAMGRSPLKEAPAGWIAAIAKIVGNNARSLTPEAVATIRSMSFAKGAATPLGPV